MKSIVADPALVACCGLYCGACGAYLKERCPGCHDNQKATWCRVRTCCREHDYSSCADCGEFEDPRKCRKYHNAIAAIVGFLFRSDRAACIAQIRKLGIQGHADTMAGRKKMTIPRGAS